eukprot:1446457-Pyramimonas_sp.AAC.1
MVVATAGGLEHTGMQRHLWRWQVLSLTPGDPGVDGRAFVGELIDVGRRVDRVRLPNLARYEM